MKQHLLDHIIATGPITLYDILGWLGEQSTLNTGKQVAMFQHLYLDGAIEHYDDDDLSLGYVAA